MLAGSAGISFFLASQLPWWIENLGRVPSVTKGIKDDVDTYWNALITDYMSQTDTTTQNIASDLDFATGKRPNADFFDFNTTGVAQSTEGRMRYDGSTIKFRNSTEEVTIPAAGGGGGGASHGPYSYIIYEDSGTHYAEDWAGNVDYSDASFETLFEQAINALVAGTGGLVFIKRGTYTVDDTLDITAADLDGVHLRIMGEGPSTVLTAQNSLDDEMFLITSTGASRTFTLEMDHLQLDGNKANNASGDGIKCIDIHRSRFHDLLINDIDDDVIVLDTDSLSSYYVWIDHNILRNFDGHGVNFLDTGAQVNDCHWVHHNTIGSSSDPQSSAVGTDAVRVAQGDGVLMIDHNFFNQLGGSGVHLDTGKHVVDANHFDRMGEHAIYLTSSTGNSIIGNRFFNCGRKTNNTYDDIHLVDGSKNNVIFGSIHWSFSGNKPRYNYNEQNAGDNQPNKLLLNVWGDAVTGDYLLEGGSGTEVAHCLT